MQQSLSIKITIQPEDGPLYHVLASASQRLRSRLLRQWAILGLQQQYGGVALPSLLPPAPSSSHTGGSDVETAATGSDDVPLSPNTSEFVESLFRSIS
jgi:hypothetical protein